MKEIHEEYRNGTGKVLRQGDRVRVDKERGEFLMLAYVVNTVTGTEWIEVCSNDRMAVFRAFRPERCHRILSRRG